MMFESMMNQEMGWFDLKDNGVGALCTRLSSEAATIQGVRNVLSFDFIMYLVSALRPQGNV